LCKTAQELAEPILAGSLATRNNDYLIYL